MFWQILSIAQVALITLIKSQDSNSENIVCGRVLIKVQSMDVIFSYLLFGFRVKVPFLKTGKAVATTKTLNNNVIRRHP